MADLLRVSIGGALPGGEVWSVNPCFQTDSPGPIVDYTLALALANAAASVTVPGALKSLWNGSTTLTDFQVEARLQGGALESVARVSYPGLATGTGAVPHPFQTSIVSSLRTANSSASGRGRLYWPATGAAIDNTTLRPSGTNIGLWLAAVKTYLSGIEAAMTTALGTGGLSLSVWSRKGPGIYPVNRIIMGDILDVQRRRRDTLKETAQVLSYP